MCVDLLHIYIYRGVDKSLARPGRKHVTATEDFEFHTYILFINIIVGILVLFIYIYIYIYIYI